jgi:hypothetical protein
MELNIEKMTHKEEKEIKKLKSQASIKLRELLVQAHYGNIYEYQISNFIDSIDDIINTRVGFREYEIKHMIEYINEKLREKEKPNDKGSP